MPTQHDSTRTRAFRRWLQSLDPDAARAIERAAPITGIAARTMQRGTQPPPTRLLDQLANEAAGRGLDALAGELAGAAQPVGASHA
jgi:hypothetical protein